MTDGRPPVTAHLAGFVTAFPSGGCPPKAVGEVKRAALDLLGVTLAGAAEPAGSLARAYAVAQSSSGPSAVVGGGHRIAPAYAALVNGTAGHALDLDDIGLGAGHVSVAVMPAALAVAELVDASGEAFVEAMALGYEVASRLTRMYDTVSGPYELGYHKPSVYAVFGGVAACGRLLGLNEGQLRHAFGIAASQAGGLRLNFGTMTKPLHAGVANRTAVEATLLAESGFTATEHAFEGRYGWYDVLCRGEGDLPTVLAGLGNGPLAVEEGMCYKRYPCCGANHHAIDAVLDLMAEHHLNLDDVAEVEVTIEARYLNEVLVYPWPATGLEGKFSLAYNVAAALADGGVTMATFTDERLAALAPVQHRVRVVADPDMPRDGARARLRTVDGREVATDRWVVKGSLDDPMTWDELAEKFTANAEGAIKEAAADEAVARLADLERQPAVRAVTELLLGAPT